MADLVGRGSPQSGSLASVAVGATQSVRSSVPSAHCVTIVVSMTPQQGQPKFQLTNTPDYREHYANSVQIRVNLWDFFLMFGTVNQTAPENVVIHNFQCIYLSPQQAKALLNILTQNISQYEATFGEIKLEPHGPSGAIQ